MSESTSTQVDVDYAIVNGMPLPSRKTRKGIVIYTLLFCSLLICLLLFKGTPGNTLHESALAWSFSVYAGVVFAYVFGAVIDTYNVLKSTKK